MKLWEEVLCFMTLLVFCHDTGLLWRPLECVWFRHRGRQCCWRGPQWGWCEYDNNLRLYTYVKILSEWHFDNVSTKVKAFQMVTNNGLYFKPVFSDTWSTDHSKQSISALVHRRYRFHQLQLSILLIQPTSLISGHWWAHYHDSFHMR